MVDMLYLFSDWRQMRFLLFASFYLSSQTATSEKCDKSEHNNAIKGEHTQIWRKKKASGIDLNMHILFYCKIRWRYFLVAIGVML